MTETWAVGSLAFLALAYSQPVPWLLLHAGLVPQCFRQVSEQPVPSERAAFCCAGEDAERPGIAPRTEPPGKPGVPGLCGTCHRAFSAATLLRSVAEVVAVGSSGTRGQREVLPVLGTSRGVLAKFLNLALRAVLCVLSSLPPEVSQENLRVGQ